LTASYDPVKILLDTHVVIWWLQDSERLSRRAFAILANLDNDILISAAVGWELAIKVSTGKMKPRSILDGLYRMLERESFSELPITLELGVRAGLLPLHHRDPFDRMLIAQALTENIPIVSNDRAFDGYGVNRLW
jgi:PIN domain nuclease of toxin-antitoxin system